MHSLPYLDTPAFKSKEEQEASLEGLPLCIDKTQILLHPPPSRHNTLSVTGRALSKDRLPGWRLVQKSEFPHPSTRASMLLFFLCIMRLAPAQLKAGAHDLTPATHSTNHETTTGEGAFHAAAEFHMRNAFWQRRTRALCLVT